MRRIVPILVILGVFSSETFAATWEQVMSACRGNPAGALGESCKAAEKLACNNSKNCQIPTPPPQDPDTNLKNCVALVDQASKDCPSTGFLPPAPAKGDAGFKEICENYNTEVQKAKTGNKGYASQCRKSIASCRAGCYALKNGGTPAGGGVPMPIARPVPGAAPDLSMQFDQAIQRCDGLEASRAAPMEKQMDELASNSIQAINCSDLASADPNSKPDGSKDPSGKTDATKGKTGSGSGMPFNPQSLMQMMQAMNQQNQEDPTEPEQPAFQDCSNPAIAGCMQTASLPQSWNQATGETSTSSADDSGGQFNPADSGMQTASLNEPQQQQFGTPATTSAVPNGGGQMLGGGGSSPASLGGAQPANYGGNPSKKVEVQTGGGGGGYSQTAANMNLKNGEGGGGYTYGGRNPAGNDGNFDLSSFLPGGKHDPFKGRNVAGSISGTGNFQIQSKDVNLFTRISERIKSRCAQGLLRDCIP